MSEARTVQPAGVLEAREVLKRSYVVLLKDVALRAGIFGGLFLAAAGLQQMWDSALSAVLLVPPAAVGLALLVLRLPAALFAMARCRRVLRHYPLELRPGADMKSRARGKFGTVFTLRVKEHQPGRSPLMRAVGARLRNSRPDGAEDVVWVAGDLPFGGVVFVPGADALLLIQPAKWEKLAPERERAGADRSARAAQARLEKQF